MQGNNPSRITSRWTFLIVSVITALLLFGSVLAQRWVFGAEQTFGPLFLAPASFQAVKGKTVDLAIKTTAIEPIRATGTQVVVKYPPDKLDFVEVNGSSQWQTVLLQNSGEVIEWVLTPAPGQPKSLALQGDTEIGKITFRALDEGFAQVTIVPEKTILAAFDDLKGTLVYNAIASTQNSAGSIVAPDEAGQAFPEAQSVSQASSQSAFSDDEPIFSLQRILATDVIPYSESAITLIRLAYRGRAVVEFGTTPSLGIRTESAQLGTSLAFQLSGLKPGTRYYYRVKIFDQSGQSVIAEPVRSFVTPEQSSAAAVAELSELVIFPAKTKDTATAYLVVRDKDQRVTKQSSPTLQVVEGKAKVSDVSVHNGIYQATITSEQQSRQLVRIQASVGGKLIDTRTLVFDPQFQEKELPTLTEGARLAWDQRTMITLSALIIALLALCLIFVRLVRSH